MNRSIGLLTVCIANVLALVACGGGYEAAQAPAAAASAPPAIAGYAAIELASDRVDPNLSNSWGLAIDSSGSIRVNDKANSLATRYEQNGTVAEVISLPAGDRLSAYTAVAVVARGDEALLYAADFRGGSVHVFDREFNRLQAPGGFVDANVPQGFAPFGIQAIGALVYVAYAKRDGQAAAAIAGEGLGLVSVFDAAGNLIRRLVAPGGKLNAPWGIARAPAGFGRFAGMLLVANSGDGTIAAFDPSGRFLGSLSTSDGAIIVIDGLRGIAFDTRPADTSIVITPSLFFTAGPDSGRHGALGRIDAR